MGREITPDQDFATLEVGRAFHEVFYENIKKEIALDGIRLDFFKRKKRIVCEVKTSSRFLEATKFQVIYYLYRLKEYGIKATGEILIPKEREKIKVYLDNENERRLLNALKEINKIVEAEKPPPPIKIQYCRKCAYKEFCWV
jgi:CRISPR-associated exonuclease Cas4